MIKKFRNDEFVNRDEEIEYLKNRFRQTPKEILWLYGPKSTGKTTLVEYILEKELKDKLFNKKYWVKYISFRRVILSSYDSFINSFFESDEIGEFDGVESEINLGVIKFKKELFKKIQNKEVNLFNELIEKLKKIDKTKIIVIDEIQALEDIYIDKEKLLLREFLNFCVALTKELHLAHIVILSSNTIFINQIYEEAKLKVTSEFKLIDHFDYKTTREYLKIKSFKDEEIELIWEYLGGCIALIQRFIRNYKNVEEELKKMQELAKNEIIFLERMVLKTEKKVKIFEDIVKIIIKDNEYQLPKIMKDEVIEVIDKMCQKEILFFDPLTNKITANNQLYKKAFEVL